MSTATGEKICSRLEDLHARVQTLSQRLLQRLLEGGAAILEAQGEMRQALQEGLREGLEKEALLGILVSVRSEAEQTADSFRRGLGIVTGDAAAVPTIEAQVRAMEEFIAWVGGLEARVSGPVPPFDESRLTATPDGRTAEGYLSVSEACARLRAGKKA